MVTTIIFDFDSCLYPHENGFEDHVRERVFAYMVKLGVSEESVRDVHAKLFAQTNQSLAALRLGKFNVDVDECGSRVLLTCAGRQSCMGLIFCPIVQDEGVKALLNSLAPFKLAVLSNADETSVHAGLEILGIAEHFEHVYGSRFMGEVCKPQHAAFQKVLDDIGCKAEECVFFDDSLKNIVGAKELGMTTVYVAGRTTAREAWDVPAVHAVADYVVPFTTLEFVSQVFPALFESTKNGMLQ